MSQDRASPSGPFTSSKSQVSVRHTNVAANSTLEVTATLVGALVGDVVMASPANALVAAGLMYSHCRVTTDGVVAVALSNFTGSASASVGAVVYEITTQRR